jgi:hypothetical protein
LSGTPGHADFPKLADVERIAGVEDAIVRNLQITQCYHELTAALGERLAGNANWCSFATWASKQAGQTIRGEDLARTLDHAFAHSPALEDAIGLVAEQMRALGAKPGVTEIRRIVIGLLSPADAAARAADAVARGNLKVFAEIGHEFARFLEQCAADALPDPAIIAGFLRGLRDGEPPEGQRFLRQAFTRYYDALFEPDAKHRAELLLLANLEVGFHEQTRLQPEIVEALHVAIADPDELTPKLITAVFPRQAAWLARARRFLRRLIGGPTPLDYAVRRLVELARREVRLVITAHLMTLAFPRGELLRLGEDLRARFPASLERIGNADLIALLARVDPTPDSVRESGASDWGDLVERMHFIADLFRCYHESEAMFDPPFAVDQVLAIKAGRRPSGRL